MMSLTIIKQEELDLKSEISSSSVPAPNIKTEFEVKSENLIVETTDSGHIKQEIDNTDIKCAKYELNEEYYLPSIQREIDNSEDSSDHRDSEIIKYEELYLKSETSSSVWAPNIKTELEVKSEDFIVKTSNCDHSKQEIDNTYIKSIKYELSQEYDLPSIKNEIDNLDHVDSKPCSSKQSQKLLKNGVKAVKKKKRYECPLCTKYFPSVVKRNRHFKSHFGKYIIVCYFCGNFVITKKEFLVHMVNYKTNSSSDRKVPVQDVQKPCKCEICLRNFVNRNCLNKRELCLKQFTLIKRNLDHMQLHTDEKPFKCEICLKQFSLKSTLTGHVRTHTGEKLFKCKICMKQFTLKNNLTVHMRTHTGEQPFKCENCLQQFTLKNNLTVHMRTHTGEKPFKCEICLKQFTLKSTLTGHVRTHTGEKPFKCEICLKHFTLKNNLTYHMRTHTGEKPFKCEICLKQFTLKSTLTGHLRTHTGEKPFNCEICLKQFTLKNNLTYHMRIHTGEKPFKCEICLKQFALKNNLTYHMRTHTAEKPFK